MKPPNAAGRSGIAIVLLACLLPGPAHAAKDFEIVPTRPAVREIAPGARAMAMGRAYTALADGSEAVWWNPAALGFGPPGIEVTYSTREAFSTVDGSRYHFAGMELARRGFGVGIHFSNLNYNQEGSTVFQPGGPVTEIDDWLYLLAAGVDLAALVPGLPEGLEAGIGAGLAYYDFNRNGRTAGDGFDLDLGTALGWTVSLGEGGTALGVRAAYVVENTFDAEIPDFGGTGRWDRAGVAIAGAFLPHDRLGMLLGAAVSVERQGLIVEYSDVLEPRDGVGAEVSFAGTVFLRAGRRWERNLDHTVGTWGIGAGILPGNPWNLSYGASIDYGDTGTGLSTGDRVSQVSVSVWTAI